MDSWTLQDAKARFSKLVDNALKGKPQRVSRRGADAVVVISASDYDTLTRPKESIVEFFMRSPLREIELDMTRVKDFARDINLD